MLEKFSLKELFNSDLQELSTRLPWIPVKILKVDSVIFNTLSCSFSHVTPHESVIVCSPEVEMDIFLVRIPLGLVLAQALA